MTVRVPVQNLKKNGSYVRNWYFRVQICINVRVQFISKLQICMAQHGPEEQVIITMEMESGRSLLDKSHPQHFALLPRLLMHLMEMYIGPQFEALQYH